MKSISRTDAIALDKFYTKPAVAAECRAILLACSPRNAVVIEPSAGAGAFLADGVIGFDIAPEHPTIGKLDFLIEWLPPDHNGMSVGETERPIVTLGNPPFGKRGDLAIQFINRAFLYGKVVGFILPIQFRKWSAQKRIVKGAKLIVDHDLPADAFTLCGQPYPVRCCFQVWSRESITLKRDRRITSAPATAHPDFECWQYNRTEGSRHYLARDWDFAVLRQGYGDYQELHERGARLDPKKQWIMFRSHDPAVVRRLREIDFAALSRRNTSTPGFGKADVMEAYRG